MAKINHEEYEILKGLDEKWKWIARDSYDRHDGNLLVYPKKPFKNHYSRAWVCGIWIHPINIHLFQFIQWDDEEPYNIQELIDEYNDDEYGYFNMKLSREFEEFIEIESEEAEVKKDIEWVKEELDTIEEGAQEILNKYVDRGPTVYRFEERLHSVNAFRHLLDQLDEPEVKQLYEKIRELETFNDELIRDNNQFRNELDNQEVLSEYWIEQKSIDTHVDTLSGEVQVTFRMDDLQSLVVSKQELPVIPKFVADWIEFKKKSRIPYENVLQAIDELVNSSTSKAHDWVLKTSENKDTFARAWLDGFTVANEEEEQKYYIDLETAAYVAKWDGNGQVDIYTDGISGSDEYELHLTEKEIKDYDERFWPFRKPVEEMEE